MKKRDNQIIVWMKKECVMLIALGLALISSFFAMPQIAYIDFKVLFLLFNLMLIIAGLAENKVLDHIAITLLQRCKTRRSVYMVLVWITFIAAMFVTNDVALLTFVPLTIIVGKKASLNMMKLVVVQTIAANIGSSLTPMGNPQNLYIYNYYNMNPGTFLKITLPLIGVGGILLVVMILLEKNKVLTMEIESIGIKDKKQTIVLFALMILVVLSVFHVIDYRVVSIIVIGSMVWLNKEVFKKVDYALLVTFIGFFVFVGNIGSMEIVKTFMNGLLQTERSTYMAGVLSSQLISNVPATMLISGFTTYKEALLLGVNIGGLGTLIASLASVISYKLYVQEYREESGKFLKVFTLYNAIGLVILFGLFLK